MTKRPTWDEYFMGIARSVSVRADCSRRQVGAIVVQPRQGNRPPHITGTGYNGSAPGGPSCLAGACPRAKSSVEPGSSYDSGPGSCIAVHAEANAIIDAGRGGCSGATIYVTAEPCTGCRRLIDASGIVKVMIP